jgi:hypothetical protein
MRAMVEWTDALDTRLCLLRHAGLTWDGIAEAMGLGRNTVLERGRKIGARRAMPRPVLALSDHRDRPTLPPGHPESWGLITAGTVLEGDAYPYPVFL